MYVENYCSPVCVVPCCNRSERASERGVHVCVIILTITIIITRTMINISTSLAHRSLSHCPGPPGQLRACSASNETFSTILVECKPGEAGGLRQSFHLEIFNFIQEYLEFNLTQQDAPVFQVTNLAPNTKYIFLLYAANSKGRSNT